jgi:hypothetical protein
MTIREIVAEYLEKNGFDGLMSECCACARTDIGKDCGIDNNYWLGCTPGYWIKCDGCDEHQFCLSPTPGGDCPSGGEDEGS